MSRFQLSVNVDDVDAAVEFYTDLLGVGPAKHHRGYANFVVADPPLKLVVVEDEGESGTINHVGIEFATTEEVAARTRKVADAGLPVEVDEPHTCCFATQEKAWTVDPDGIPWELYTVVADRAGFGASPRGGTPLDVMVPPVELAELRAALDDPAAIVLDAQGPGGWELAHVPGAVDIDVADVAARAQELINDPDRRIVVYCSDGACRGSEVVGAQLVDAGFTNVRRYVDGIDGWRRAGLPLIEQP